MAKKKFYRPILYIFLIALKKVLFILPFSFGLHFVGFLGELTFRFIQKERQKTITHLKLAFPGMTDRDLFYLGLKVFRYYGYIAVELALIERTMKRFDRFVSVSGIEYLNAARALGKGVVAVSAHFGNWEILAGYLSMQGFPGSVVARKIYYPKYNQMLVALREKMKIKTIYRDESPREILRALGQNQVVGFLPDQDVETIDGVFVQFFGKPAYTPTAPVRFAMKTGAPLIPLFIVRHGLRHQIMIEPPIKMSQTGDAEKDLVENTQRWVCIQEAYIREYPHLWVWNHKRWKTAPEALKTA